MSLSKNTAGDDYIRISNIRPYAIASGYTTPAVGDLVKLSTATADAVARCAAGDNAFGIILSVNSANGILSVAELLDGVTLTLEYTSTAPTLGQKVWSNGDRGTIYASRDRVIQNSGGTGVVVAVDSSSPAGTGTCVARWP